MRIRVLSVALLLIGSSLGIGCSSSTDTSAPSGDLPIIRSLSSDTAVVGTYVAIYGRHLEYCTVWIGDVKVPAADSLNSNYTYFIVPPDATTDYVYVSNDGSYRARSPRPLVIVKPPGLSTFYLSKISDDSGSIGDRMVIYGRHILSMKDSIALLLNNRTVPIDEFYDDSLVFRVPPTASTGTFQIVTKDRIFWASSFTLTTRLVWRHATISVIGYEYTARHRRTGTMDHGRYFDSSWNEQVVLNWSTAFDLKDPRAVRQSGIYQFTTQVISSSPYGNRLSLYWADTGYSTAAVQIFGHGAVLLPVSITVDTSWSFQSSSLSGRIEPAQSTHLTMPLAVATISLGITRVESDHEGDHSWTESVDATSNSGVGRLTIDLEP
jgi:hypothetical protein